MENVTSSRLAAITMRFLAMTLLLLLLLVFTLGALAMSPDAARPAPILILTDPAPAVKPRRVPPAAEVEVSGAQMRP